MKKARSKSKKTSSSKIRITKKGVAKILSILILAALFAWFFVFTHIEPGTSTETSSYAAKPNTAATEQVVVEAETFSTYARSGGLSYFDDPNASGGRSMMYTINTTSEGTVSLVNPTTKVTITAKADRCHGGPTMVLSIDEKELINKKIPASSWTDYSADLALAPGSHRVTISFLNDFATDTGGGCDRILYVDKLTFQ